MDPKKVGNVLESEINQSTSETLLEKCSDIKMDISNILQKVSDLAPDDFVVSGELDNSPPIEIRLTVNSMLFGLGLYDFVILSGLLHRISAVGEFIFQ